MTVIAIYLFCMLIIILIASQLFTNALEHFGEKIGISAGVTGSIFAAVATALPETTVPILAIVAGTSSKTVNEQISVGAILGAPLMLSTLSLFLVSLFAIKNRGIFGKLIPERTGLTRDLDFFLCAFFIAAVAMYIPLQPAFLRAFISVVLVGIYITYIFFTVKASKGLVEKGHGVTTQETLFITRMGFKNNSLSICIQLLSGLALLLFGAKGFIDDTEKLSIVLHISPLLLSLLIIPLATELPEKVNSILWIRKNKDTLSFGNITGAMVFQGTLLPALGIMLTPWQPTRYVEAGIFVTFIAAAWLRLNASRTNLRVSALFINGMLYLMYLVFILL